MAVHKIGGITSLPTVYEVILQIKIHISLNIQYSLPQGQPLLDNRCLSFFSNFCKLTTLNLNLLVYNIRHLYKYVNILYINKKNLSGGCLVVYSHYGDIRWFCKLIYLVMSNWFQPSFTASSTAVRRTVRIAWKWSKLFMS